MPKGARHEAPGLLSGHYSSFPIPNRGAFRIEGHQAELVARRQQPHNMKDGQPQPVGGRVRKSASQHQQTHVFPPNGGLLGGQVCWMLPRLSYGPGQPLGKGDLGGVPQRLACSL